jgi:diguanylate cyclase (GGDEF)-like protein/putative nucleotidyltransferase with HDIG domain
MAVVHIQTAWSLMPPNGSLPPPAERLSRILVIDGTSAISHRVKLALPITTYDLAVRTGADRLARAIEELDPDLLIVDVSLSDPSAFEVCSELRATDIGRGIPILLVTTAARADEEVARGLLCGADDFLTIDERVGEFQARVRVQLRNRRERDRLARLRKERDAYRREAVVDTLTGVPNRRSIRTTLERLLTSEWQFGVLFFDVDHFKKVNDTFGHEVGDVVLKAVATALESCLGPEDHLGRYGGEEFVVVLAGADRELALAAGERYRTAIERLLVPELGRPVTVSVGVALFDPEEPDATIDVIVARADAALYTSKRTGRNRVTVARKDDAPPSTPPEVRISKAPESDEGAIEAALLRELASERAGLPLLPQAAAEALRLAEDPRTSMAHIARLVERDPPLAARFIAIASSAAYSRGPRAATMQVALVRIGLATSRDLLLQVVYERSNRELSKYQAEVARSFDHSVQTGIAARAVAKEMRITYDNAYLCGLLHDIGEARIYRILAKLPASPSSGPFLRALVDAHHMRAGADVALAWKLPRDIVDVCTHHHSPGDVNIVAVRIVKAAEALINSLREAPFNPFQPMANVHPEDLEVLSRVGIKAERVPALLTDVERQISAHRDVGVAT